MASRIQYAPPVEKFENTKEFSFLADHFIKHGCYTFIPAGTEKYNDFWGKVKYYCESGFTNSKNQSISGPHFFYLNFIQILGKDEITGRKKKIFPRFLDVDYDYFHICEYARKHQKGVLLVKPRRLGFSYKAAALCTHEYNFFRDSKCIISAFLSSYSQTTMNMVLDNLNFLDTYTEFRKQRNPNTKDFIKAQYMMNIGGANVWKGMKSEVMSLTFKDNPYASVGKTASVFIMDEAGIFPNIIESYNMTEPTIKDGSDFIGVCLIFGSAGSMEEGTQYFYEMFINPAKYNMLEFDAGEGIKTGWFVSASRGRLGTAFNGERMVDEDGNSNEALATEDILREREIKKGSGDAKAYWQSTTQYPLSYKEAFLRSKNNIFPTVDLQEHLGKIETTAALRASGVTGELYFDSENKLKFKHNPDLKQIINFPLKSDESKLGCITIWEQPERENEVIPNFLYVAGCDPYDQDKSGTNSLGSIFIYKRFYRADKTHDIIVAEYTGRPELADDFYENCRRLLLFYNAKCLYENQLKGLKVYFETKHCLHLLYETPAILKDIVKDSKVNRGYGIHMNRGANGASGIKDQCEIYLKQWLLTEKIVLDEKGENKKVLNLHTILSQALLKELISYNREDNFDRVISFMLCVLQTKELHKIHIEQHNTPMTDTESFFKRILFKKTNNYSHIK